jgi:hypothetical protein
MTTKIKPASGLVFLISISFVAQGASQQIARRSSDA